jgi:hypothetical protein
MNGTLWNDPRWRRVETVRCNEHNCLLRWSSLDAWAENCGTAEHIGYMYMVIWEAVPVAPPTMWQRLKKLLLGRWRKDGRA